MNAKLIKLATTLMITAMILSLSQTNMKIAYSNNAAGKIDLFTQKEPYSGKGPNMPSDAFSPEEEVQVFALTTYNEFPTSNILVAFGIVGPKNPVENITFARTALTNEKGIATISFRISGLNETTFGEWTVIGNARIGDLTVEDIVMFKVGWIVEIVSLETINENYMPQEEFRRGSNVGIELVLRNIAMTDKLVTIIVVIYDSLDIPVNETESIDFPVPPNGILVNVHFFLYIPKTAHIGRAKVYSCICTAPAEYNGVPCCPEVSKYFSIIAGAYFLKVRTEPSNIVAITGEGWYEENTNVSLTAPNDVLISTSIRYKFNYWDVDGITKGVGVNSINILMDANHTATAHYTQILTYTLTITATVGGTTNPAPGNYTYTAGTTVQVTATPSANYIFDHWELDNVDVGSANSYSVLMDKNHTLKAVFSLAPAGWFVPDWFYWLLLPLLIIIIALLIILLYRRRKGKEAKEAFYSGWTAWYYHHNLRSKNRRI